MASCISPYNLKTGEKVPCGRCSNCIMRRVNGWAHRLQKEWLRADSGYFVTLTYSNSKVPITSNGFMTLSKSDVQSFMKRVRYYCRERYINKKIYYYLVGEYGSRTKRPHYHAIIMNADRQSIIDAWSYISKTGDRNEIGTWHFGDINDATIYYTLKYMHKDYGYKKSFDRDDRQREFSIMSKGIGKSYSESDVVRSFHRTNRASYIQHPDGYKSAMPRYYRDSIFSSEEVQEIVLENMNEYRRKEDEHVKDMLKKYGDDYPRVLHEQKVRNLEKLKNFKYGRDKV